MNWARCVRFSGVLMLTLFSAAWLASGSARADGYPSEPIRFICTSAAGSPLDIMMRQLGKSLGEQLKQTVIVENRTGGTGAVGMAAALNRPADGYTIVAETGSTSFMMAEGQTKYTPDDFITLRGLQAEPSAVAVRRDSPYHSLQALVDALRKTPDKVNVGGYAAAGFHQYVFYHFQQAAKFKTEWIPFNGGNEAATALLGGHIDAAVMTPSSALGALRNGDIRLLAISTAQRDPYFPDVPTFREQGYDVVEALWRGVMVKKGTPAPVIAVLTSAMDRVEATPDWQQFMRVNLQSPMHKSVDEMQAMVRDEVRTRREFLKSIGVAH
ncbi:MAG: tripartite tricarboxylate transporter substrate binding protein [Casimicrobiaceae bacterium]